MTHFSSARLRPLPEVGKEFLVNRDIPFVSITTSNHNFSILVGLASMMGRLATINGERKADELATNFVDIMQLSLWLVYSFPRQFLSMNNFMIIL
jgi:hypothetical protein